MKTQPGPHKDRGGGLCPHDSKQQTQQRESPPPTRAGGGWGGGGGGGAVPKCTPRREWGGCRVLRAPPEDLSPPHQDRHQLSHWVLPTVRRGRHQTTKLVNTNTTKLTRGRSASPPRTTTKSQKMKSHTYQGQMQSRKISHYKTTLSTKKCTYTCERTKITLNQKLKI